MRNCGYRLKIIEADIFFYARSAIEKMPCALQMAKGTPSKARPLGELAAL